MATRAAGVILRTGAVGAVEEASGSRPRLICRLIRRQICRVGNFATERGTHSRQTIPTATETWDTRGGGQQRGTGHHHWRTRTDIGSRVTRGALARALTATLEAGTASAILPTTGVIFDSSGRSPAITIIMVYPRLGPTPFTRGSTGTDTISLWTRGLPSSSSSTNASKAARLLPRLPRQLSLLRIPAQLQRVALPCSSSSHVM